MTNGGKHWYNNGSINKMFFEGEQPSEFVPGKLEKNSSCRTRGKIMYNNGMECRYFDKDEQIPEGFVKGCLPEFKNHLQSISGNQLGKSKSNETKAKLSASAKERLADPTHHGMYGKHHSDEAKKKMSDAKIGSTSWNKGKKYTDAQKEKQYKSHIEHYGSIEEWKKITAEKNKQTKLERYGDSNYNNYEKAKQTFLSNPIAQKSKQEKTRATKISLYGSVKAHWKNTTEKTIVKNSPFNSADDYYADWRTKLYNKHPHKGSSLEKKIEEFLHNNGFSYKAGFLLKNSKYKHEFDFAIFNADNLVMLVDCDGLYYHGFYSDVDGKHVNSYSDDYRSQLVPENVKFLVIYEDEVDKGLQELLFLQNITYDEYVDDIFTWCRRQEFPYPSYSSDILMSSWNSLLKSDLAKFSLKARYGEKLLLNFHKSIWDGHKRGKPSPIEAWSNDELLKNAIKNRIIYKGHDLDPSKVLNGLWVSGIAPRVSIFNPNLAKYIIYKYLNDFSVIFDPCSGYSGRLLGALSLNKKYIGQDINCTTINESNQLIKFLNSSDAIVSCCDSTSSSGNYECMFTCPPYSSKEVWKDTGCNIYSADQWIKLLLEKYKCKKYVFVVDETYEYKEFIVETLTNKSHFGINTEYIIVIE